jgi:hypothetical protein
MLNGSMGYPVSLGPMPSGFTDLLGNSLMPDMPEGQDLPAPQYRESEVRKARALHHAGIDSGTKLGLAARGGKADRGTAESLSGSGNAAAAVVSNNSSLPAWVFLFRRLRTSKRRQPLARRRLEA